MDHSWGRMTRLGRKAVIQDPKPDWALEIGGQAVCKVPQNTDTVLLLRVGLMMAICCATGIIPRVDRHCLCRYCARDASMASGNQTSSFPAPAKGEANYEHDLHADGTKKMAGRKQKKNGMSDKTSEADVSRCRHMAG
ncbi:hypothetical protein ANO11243_072830 [Dothideomycetidae sp. 11243]|nr:hypothetical protein ANO11243_072830 [fungal sp. No.11243]